MYGVAVLVHVSVVTLTMLGVRAVVLNADLTNMPAQTLSSSALRSTADTAIALHTYTTSTYSPLISSGIIVEKQQ
jgi:hypothetical protein